MFLVDGESTTASHHPLQDELHSKFLIPDSGRQSDFLLEIEVTGPAKARPVNAGHRARRLRRCRRGRRWTGAGDRLRYSRLAGQGCGTEEGRHTERATPCPTEPSTCTRQKSRWSAGCVSGGSTYAELHGGRRQQWSPRCAALLCSVMFSPIFSATVTPFHDGRQGARVW